MKSYVGRLLPLLFIVALVLTITDSLVFFISLQNLIDAQRWVDHSHMVIAEVEATSSSIKDAESAMRGYIITGNDEFYKPYKPSIQQSAYHLKRLRKLTEDNTEQAKNVRIFSQEINSRVANLEEAFTARQNEGFDAAESVVNEGNGRKKMQEINSTVLAMENEENSLLKDRAKETAAGVDGMYSSIIVAMILDLILVVVSFLFIRRELSQRSLAEQRKNDFISIASHELKTPITSMRVFTDLLERRILSLKDRKASHYTKKIREQILKQTLLINDLLDISKMQAGKIELQKEAFDLNKLIRDTVEIMRTTSVTHKFIVKGKVRDKVFGDRQRIGQVLVNLLTNAVKYSPKANKIIIIISEESQFAKVSVRDFGIGIAKRHQRKIFNRFYRALEDKNFPGLGIGLYITFEIVRRHEGKIWVESEEGKGSIFTFTIPVARYI